MVSRLFSSTRSSRFSSSLGMTRVISAIALSTNTPVGLPAASRMISPPSGALESRVMPAAFRAAVLAQPAWPSTRVNQAGRSPVTSSSSAAVGKRLINLPSAYQRSWFQPRPMIQPVAGMPALMRPRASGMEALSRRSTTSLSSPNRITWPWASIRPGHSVAPAMSTFAPAGSAAPAFNVAFTLPASSTTSVAKRCNSPLLSSV